ncbi:MAG: TrbC/VirB2 family protein [Pseudomonadota bacterium]
MKNSSSRRSSSIGRAALLYGLLLPAMTFAQSSPFQTGADAFVTNLVAIATPIAIIFVMALGIAALLGRVSWGWPAAALVGIGVLFGAPQIVTWVRGLFAV